MDASCLEMVKAMLIIQRAPLIGMMTMLARALLMMRCMDIRTMAMLGEVGLMRTMETLALGLVLGVHGVMSRLMIGMDLVERAVRGAISLVLQGAKHARVAFSARRFLTCLTSFLMIAGVLVAHFRFGLLGFVYLASISSCMFNHYFLP